MVLELKVQRPFALPISQLHWLEKEARKRDISMAEIIRQLITREMEGK